MWRDNTENPFGRWFNKAIFIGGCKIWATVVGNPLSFGNLPLGYIVVGIKNSPVTRPGGAIRLHECGSSGRVTGRGMPHFQLIG